MLSPVNAQVLQEIQIFFFPPSTYWHCTKQDLEFKSSLPPPQKVLWSTRQDSPGKNGLLFILDSPAVKMQKQWERESGMWARESDFHVCCLGYLPLMARFRSWSQLHSLTVCNQSQNTAKPALNNLRSWDQTHAFLLPSDYLI